MSTEQMRRTSGVTLIEVMLAILILSIAVFGASGYRYHATLDARKADMHSTAARIGLLLCESWRGVKGTETYDPTAYFASELTITTITVPYEFEYTGFTLLGGYAVVLNGANYYAILSWKDVYTGLRALNVVVAWSPREQVSIAGAYKLFELTTYTPN